MLKRGATLCISQLIRLQRLHYIMFKRFDTPYVAVYYLIRADYAYDALANYLLYQII